MKAILKSTLVVTVMAATAFTAATGTASASIWVENQQLGLRALSADGGQCIRANSPQGSFISDCQLWGSEDDWNLESVYPDAPNHAYAQVRIRSTNLNECLTVLNQAGPPGGASKEVSPRACDGSPSQEWASTRSADGYLNYFNFQYRVCLDGGYGDTYGFPENGCNANGENHYQDWYYLPAA
ncbi:hypothetical protein ACIRVK_35590 [Streptomyces sp. NPDC101152]|uniref:hypothetical protein n=1 Tax=Streptomyces sp. NPDC101152 TaxID=3366116 RepID=UPI00382A2BC9